MNAKPAKPDRQPIPVLKYYRQSDLRIGEYSKEEREEILDTHADERGYIVVGEVIENDVIEKGRKRARRGDRQHASAFGRRKVTRPDGRVELRVVRPAFASILDRMRSGEIKGFITEDIDRAMRDPKDLEELIDVIELYPGTVATSPSGSLGFTVEAGRVQRDRQIQDARAAVNAANANSMAMRRRTIGARRRAAMAGRFGGGTRRYGFEATADAAGRPVPVPAEQERIRDWADLVRANGGSDANLRGIARALNLAGVPTPNGGQRWVSTTIRGILLRPLNAGIVVHGGEPQPGIVAQWKPILPVEVWEEVTAILTDPARVTKPGQANRYLGSGIYLCACGKPVGVRSEVAAGTTRTGKPRQVKAPAYRCELEGKGRNNGHVSRIVADVDDHVLVCVAEAIGTGDVLERLNLTRDSRVEINALRKQIKELDDRALFYVDQHGTGNMSDAQFVKASRQTRDQIDALSAKRDRLVSAQPLAALVKLAEEPDIEKALRALSLATQRAILREAFTVTILPSVTRGRWFDQSRVIVAPRTDMRH